MKSSQSNNTNRRQFLKSAVLSGVGMAAGGISIPSASADAAQKPLVLATQGKSTYSILISQAAPPSEHRAAAELQRFIEEMSGARLPIISDAEEPKGDLVLVGDSSQLQKFGLEIPFAGLGAEGFVLRTHGEHLIIAGGKPRGTMYGVYTFLDRLGCRWFTTEVSVIPKKPTLVFKPHIEWQKPAFEYREPFFIEAFDKDWAARNRVNGSFLSLDESTGGKVSYYPFVHSFYAILPPKQYFRDHPEYYALVDGQRRGEDVYAQLCLTNPDVLRLAIQTVLKWIDEHPDVTIFSVSQNDTLGWCECENCQRVEQEEGGAHSGPILRFVNAVAAEVGKTHPDKLIDTLAYSYSEPPPLKVRPLPNVRIRLCPIGTCAGQAFDRCVYNRYFLNHLQEWAKITDQLYIWHYVTNFRHYLLPYPDFDELAADIPMYKKNGVVGIFLEGDAAPGGGGENAELRSYVMARLLWNPNINVDETVNEFMAAYYGKAARVMRAYFDLQHRQVRLPPQGEGNHTWISTQPGAPYLSPAFLTQATKLLDEAESTAADAATRKRVQKARLCIDYVKVMHAKAFIVQGGSYAPENLDQLKENFRRLLADTRSFGITSFHEGRTLEVDEREFAKNIKPYRVATLESSALRVIVAPELSGRIISIIDKATSTDFLHHADPSESAYPDTCGLGAFVHADHHLRNPYDAVWELQAQPGPLEIHLTGTCPNGLKMQRTIRLLAEKPVIHTETTVENGGSSAVDAVLNSSGDFSAKRLVESAVIFRSQAGMAVQKKVLSPGEDPEGVQWYAGRDLPDGEWTLQGVGNDSRWHAGSEQPNGEYTLTGVGTRMAVVNSFPKDQVTRCMVKWSRRKEAPLTMTLWSAKRSLAPGATLKLEADYEIRQVS
jgi:hypothetical protein